MTKAKPFPQEEHQNVQTAFEPSRTLNWTVKENAKLETELNQGSKGPESLDSGLVHRVVDCIKDL